MAKLGIYEEFTLGNFEYNYMDSVHRLMVMMFFTVFYTKLCPMPGLTKNLYLAPDSTSSKAKPD